MSESDTPRETCETCYGLGRVDAVYAPCPDCELTAARRLAEKYRNLSCDSQDEADATILPWEIINQNKQ